MNDSVTEFLEESNNIEDVWDIDSFQQAMFAWQYVIGQEKLTPGVILKTHKILMLHQPLMPDEKGYFRTVPVWVGNREGIDHTLIRKSIEDWCELVEKTSTAEFPEEWIKQLHIQYEVIHPFVDGNGRTGRIFLNWQRVKAGLPILVIKEKEKYKYYEWFRRA
jgi:Fic family protein